MVLMSEALRVAEAVSARRDCHCYGPVFEVALG